MRTEPSGRSDIIRKLRGWTERSILMLYATLYRPVLSYAGRSGTGSSSSLHECKHGPSCLVHHVVWYHRHLSASNCAVWSSYCLVAGLRWSGEVPGGVNRLLNGLFDGAGAQERGIKNLRLLPFRLCQQMSNRYTSDPSAVCLSAHWSRVYWDIRFVNVHPGLLLDTSLVEDVKRHLISPEPSMFETLKDRASAYLQVWLSLQLVLEVFPQI